MNNILDSQAAWILVMVYAFSILLSLILIREVFLRDIEKDFDPAMTYFAVRFIFRPTSLIPGVNTLMVIYLYFELKARERNPERR